MSMGSRFQSVKFGIHSSASDFTTMPSTAVVLPRSFVPTLLPRARLPISRGAMPAVDGRRQAQLRGAKDLKAIEVPMFFRGVNSNTGAAVAAWEAKLEQGTMLQSLFGAVAPATTGAAPTASGTAGSVLTSSSTVLANNDVVFFTTSTGNWVRRILSGGGTTSLTLNQAFTGTPSGTIIRLGVYTMNPALTHHVHGAFDAEQLVDGTGLQRRQFLGCAPSKATLKIPAVGNLEFNTTWMPSDIALASPATPTYADPTAGDHISASGYEFRLGSTTLNLLGDATLTIDNSVEMRSTGAGINGVLGGLCGAGEGKVAMFEATVYVGATTPGNELQDATGTPSVRDLLGVSDAVGKIASTQDLMLGIATAAGALMGIFMPAADIVAEEVQSGSFNALKLTAYGTGATPLVLAVG